MLTTTVDLQGNSNILRLEVPRGKFFLCVCFSLFHPTLALLSELLQKTRCPVRDLPNEKPELLPLPLESLDMEGSNFSAPLRKIGLPQATRPLGKRLHFPCEFRPAAHIEQQNSLFSPLSSPTDQLPFDTMGKFQYWNPIAATGDYSPNC